MTRQTRRSRVRKYRKTQKGGLNIIRRSLLNWGVPMSTITNRTQLMDAVENGDFNKTIDCLMKIVAGTPIVSILEEIRNFKKWHITQESIDDPINTPLEQDNFDANLVKIESFCKKSNIPHTNFTDPIACTLAGITKRSYREGTGPSSLINPESNKNKQEIEDMVNEYLKIKDDYYILKKQEPFMIELGKYQPEVLDEYLHDINKKRRELLSIKESIEDMMKNNTHPFSLFDKDSGIPNVYFKIVMTSLHDELKKLDSGVSKQIISEVTKQTNGGKSALTFACLRPEPTLETYVTVYTLLNLGNYNNGKDGTDDLYRNGLNNLTLVNDKEKNKAGKFNSGPITMNYITKTRNMSILNRKTEVGSVQNAIITLLYIYSSDTIKTAEVPSVYSNKPDKPDLKMPAITGFNEAIRAIEAVIGQEVRLPNTTKMKPSVVILAHIMRSLGNPKIPKIPVSYDVKQMLDKIMQNPTAAKAVSNFIIKYKLELELSQQANPPKLGVVAEQVAKIENRLRVT